jgi:hypothetical protein
MPKALDLTGQKFGRLTALYREESRGGKTYWRCKCECGNEKSVQTAHLKSGAIQSCGCLAWEANQAKAQNQSLMKDISDEDFALIVQHSTSFTDVARSCGYANIGGASIAIVKKRIERQQLSIQHFARKTIVKRSAENVFIKDSTADQATLRRYYLQGNYTEYKCSICGQEPFWNGKELTLTLDHINGINNDDRLENLRWVCPNCDRQLDTFAGKNKHNK